MFSKALLAMMIGSMVGCGETLSADVFAIVHDQLDELVQSGVVNKNTINKI